MTSLFRYPLLPDKDNFCLLENGSLVITDQHKLLSPAQFCFETVNVGDENEKWVTSPFVCVPLPPPNKNIIFLIIYAICKTNTQWLGLFKIYFVSGLAISCVALALICILYGYFLINPLPHRKSVIFYSACLLGSYLVVAVAQIIHPTAYTCDLLGNTDTADQILINL